VKDLNAEGSESLGAQLDTPFASITPTTLSTSTS
jgi:hypothetical protein